MKFKDFQAPVLFSSIFKALNLGEKNSSTFKNFQGRVGTLSTTWFLGPTSVSPNKQHLNRFSRFRTAHPCAQHTQTDTQTTLCSNRPHQCNVCRRCSLKLTTCRTRRPATLPSRLSVACNQRFCMPQRQCIVVWSHYPHYMRSFTGCGCPSASSTSRVY